MCDAHEWQLVSIQDGFLILQPSGQESYHGVDENESQVSSCVSYHTQAVPSHISGKERGTDNDKD